MFISSLGAIFFGVVIGWIVYRILRSREGATTLSDLITFLGVIGATAVIALLKSDVLFGWYSLGLVVGFFGYLTTGLILYGTQELYPWRIGRISPPSLSDTSSEAPPAPDAGEAN
jgi:hypothetical protein